MVVSNTVRLDIYGSLWVKPCLRIRLTHHFHLGFFRRHCDTWGSAIRVNSSPSNDSLNWIAVAERGTQRFQNKCCNALSSAKTIRSAVKRVTTPVVREKSNLWLKLNFMGTELA
jgi:hypothetical protein